MVNQGGVLVKNGGNIASYFCTPDGRVIHAVTGPVPAQELLAAARWAVDVSSDGKGVDDPDRIGAAHRQELERASRPVASPAEKIHRLLASQPLPPLNEVYRTIFEDILGQRVSPPDTERVQAERAFAAARRAKLPVLLILHKRRDNRQILDEWNRITTAVTRSTPLTGLARSYVVLAMRLEELPALSRQLGIPPYAAPDRGSPQFVITRSDARQLTAVTTWDKPDELAYAMAQGIVQEAKEHERSPEQLRALLTVVDLVDAGLGAEVRRLMGRPGKAQPPDRASQVGRPPRKA